MFRLGGRLNFRGVSVKEAPRIVSEYTLGCGLKQSDTDNFNVNGNINCDFEYNLLKFILYLCLESN